MPGETGEQAADGQPPGEDGWETSTELPGVSGAEDGGEVAGSDGDGENDDPGAGEEVAGGGPEAGEEESPGGLDEEQEGSPGGGGEDELARALEDFDGEILEGRIAAANQRRGEDPLLGQTGDASQGSAGGVQAADGAGSDAGGGAMPGRGTVASAVPRMPGPPLPAAPDTPDARDDDVVARQIREAAMNETDPELRERLWEEYERYKSGR